MTRDGPCLVEVGARMHGLKGPYMTQLATGLGIHELVADVLVNEGRLHKSLAEKHYRYSVKKYCFELMLNNLAVHGKEGILQLPLDRDDRLNGLKSCIAVHPGIKPGEELKITRDLATSPGCLMLCHANLDQCWEDIRKARHWEETDLYVVGTERITSPTSTEPALSIPKYASGLSIPGRTESSSKLIGHHVSCQVASPNPVADSRRNNSVSSEHELFVAVPDANLNGTLGDHKESICAATQKKLSIAGSNRNTDITGEPSNLYKAGC